MQNALFARLLVDKRAVGAAEVDQSASVVLQSKLGVAARDLRVVQPDLIGPVPSDSMHRQRQLKLLPLIRTFDND
jgi:hypothetical protein